MVTTRGLIAKFGNPEEDRATFERNYMIIAITPDSIKSQIPAIPAKIYINKIAAPKLLLALNAVIAAGCAHEIKTWDGCFNVRKQRGSKSISRHSFGIAIDLNAALNPLVLGVTPASRPGLRLANVKWSEKFLDCWRSTGWVCGADWETRLDGMHFEIDKI